MIRFISLGPGAADMVTLGTLRLLTKAEKVYCFAVGESSRAAEIIAQLDIDQSHHEPLKSSHSWILIRVR